MKKRKKMSFMTIWHVTGERDDQDFEICQDIAVVIIPNQSRDPNQSRHSGDASEESVRNLDVTPADN